jgi:hypothetical protein
VNTERGLPLVETGGSIGVVSGLRGGSTSAARLAGATQPVLKSALTSSIMTGQPFTMAVFVKLYTAPFHDDAGGSGAAWLIGPGVDENFLKYFALYDNDYTDYSGFVASSYNDPHYAEAGDPPTLDMAWAPLVGVWQHVAFGYDGTNIWIQRNGGTRHSAVADSNVLPIADGYMAVGGAFHSDGSRTPDAAFQFLAHWDDRALSEAGRRAALQRRARAIAR